VSKLYIVEFASTAIGARGQDVMAPQYPAAAETAGDHHNRSHAESAAFGGTTRFFNITPTRFALSISVRFPIADTSFDRMAANETRFVGVSPGHKLSVIANT